MKRLILTIILITNVLFARAQQDSISNWFNKYQEFRYQNKKGENYVHLIITKGGRKKILYQYIQIDTTIIVRLFDSSETIKVIPLKKDELIEYIENNLSFLLKLKRGKIDRYLKQNLLNPDIYTSRVSININKLNYNNFYIKSEAEVEKIKDENAKIGQILINNIGKYFIDKFKTSFSK